MFQLDTISKADKLILDDGFIKMLIASNMSFAVVENPAVVAFFKALRPAYKLPTRYEVCL